MFSPPLDDSDPLFADVLDVPTSLPPPLIMDKRKTGKTPHQRSVIKPSSSSTSSARTHAYDLSASAVDNNSHGSYAATFSPPMSSHSHLHPRRIRKPEWDRKYDTTKRSKRHGRTFLLCQQDRFTGAGEFGTVIDDLLKIIERAQPESLGMTEDYPGQFKVIFHQDAIAHARKKVEAFPDRSMWRVWLNSETNARFGAIMDFVCPTASASLTSSKGKVTVPVFLELLLDLVGSKRSEDGRIVWPPENLGLLQVVPVESPGLTLQVSSPNFLRCFALTLFF